jgi:hypothetical protein
VAPFLKRERSTHSWLNRDPIQERGEINLYRFNYNSPLYYIDRDGLTPRGASIGASIGFGLGGLLGGAIGGAGGTLVLPGGGTLVGAGEVGAAGAAWGTALGAAAGNAISDLWNDVSPKPIQVCESRGFPPGYLPGDRGAEEWGRRNGVDPDEARGDFHDIKGDDPMSGPADKYGVNPSTGDVIDPEGESIGNLGD